MKKSIHLKQRNSKHFSSIGTGLRFAVSNYNNAVGSFESRFIPSAKKMKELGDSSFKEEVSDLNSIELAIRPINEIK
jgi:DNA recombination protein RmuC